MPAPGSSRLPYPPPTRRSGESTAAYNRRVDEWDRATGGGRHAPRPGGEPTSARSTVAAAESRSVATGTSTNPAGDRISDRYRIDPPSTDRRGTGGTVTPLGSSPPVRPTSVYGASERPPTYNTGDPFGLGSGSGGSVVWGTTATNEPGYGDADKPTTTTVDYDFRQAQEWLLKLSQSSPSEYADMVYQLWQAGYIGGSKEDLITGAFSTEVATAFQGLYVDVDRINAGGNDQSIFDYLDSRIQGRIESGALDANGNAPPPPRSYTDPETLMASVRAASEDVLGRRLTDEEASKFASHFRGLEDSAYGASENNQNYTAPDVGGQAESFVYDEFAAEESQMAGGRYVATLRSMMGLG